jgi:cytosine/adenosine deaminase-related metal-dependent hydrolase
MTGRDNETRVNAHTHLYSGLAPFGMPEPDPPPRDFPEILERVWWRLDRALDPESLRASARLYLAEAVVHGTFALADHHESPNFIDGSLDLLADACQEFGMRALLCYGATERNHGRDEARRGLDECRRFASDNRRPLVRGLVGLHAPFTVSDETIRDAVALCHELSTTLHVHVAEDSIDVTDARERGYAGVIDRLDQLGALIPGSIFAHGVKLEPAEVARCQDSGVWLVQNPRSNRGNRVGYPHALAHSERVALGTDGYPADMDAEQDALLREAEAAGDDLERARLRADAGHALMREHLGAAAEVSAEQAEQARQRVRSSLASIREQARDLATGLWTRMQRV